MPRPEPARLTTRVDVIEYIAETIVQGWTPQQYRLLLDAIDDHALDTLLENLIIRSFRRNYPISAEEYFSRSDPMS
jgi:hypothetical protein